MSLNELFPMFVRRGVPLSLYTRLQLGGTAEFFAEPKNEDDLLTLYAHCQKERIPILVLGLGSSLLVSESEVSGVVLALSEPEFCRIAVEGQCITAGAGAHFGQVITHAVSQGLGGIEAFVGMPGSFGGAICGNIGTMHGGDLGHWVESVRVLNLDGKISVIPKEEILFGYRKTSLDDVIVISATLRLEKENPIELAKRMRKLWIIRKTQQPTGEITSVRAFNDPETGLSASELIGQAGLQGMRIGGAMVSECNPCFISVEEESVSDDVLRLIHLVQEQVFQQTEIELETALHIW